MLGRVSPALSEPISKGFIEFIGGPLGRYAAVGTQRWWTPLRVLIVTALTFLSFGFLAKTNCIQGKRGDSGVTLDWSGNRHLASACYNDIVPLFGGRGLDKPGFPYAFSWQEGALTRYMEYPVLGGMFQWLSASISRAFYPLVKMMPGNTIPDVGFYFMVTAFLMAIMWVLTIRMVVELTGNRIWDTVLVAASPLVIMHAFTNWDLPSIFFAVAALWAVKRNHIWWAGVFIGLGTAFKLWPLYLLGAFFILAIRSKQFVPFIKMVVAAAAVWVAVNLPVMLAYPKAWREFLRLNSERGAEWTTIYATFTRVTNINFEVSTLNTLSFAGFAISCLAILIFGLKSKRTPRVAQLVALIIIGFLIFNKVYSPQYSLWLIIPLALAIPNWRLNFSWQVADAMVWPILMWHMMGEDKLGAPGELLTIAVIARDAFIITFAVLIIRSMMGIGADKVYDAHEGRDPLAGPFRMPVQDEYKEPVVEQGVESVEEARV
ncbi:glycosyltransferase family 87 protein [Corynebacterium sp. H130]|uniref:glycosyltransferase family 87 protein n=1 Tax=Corynebacterium sp. H130 TaxID=3133444 RepID=UPI0030ADB2EE